MKAVRARPDKAGRDPTPGTMPGRVTNRSFGVGHQRSTDNDLGSAQVLLLIESRFRFTLLAVIPRLRHRSAASLRVIAYAIFALSLLLRPVLASMGEMHEFAHESAGQHLDVGDGSVHHHDEPAPHDSGSDEDGSGALHTLLHLAHCCGQGAAVQFAVAFDPVRLEPSSRAEAALDADVRQASWPTPFRPPITT